MFGYALIQCSGLFALIYRKIFFWGTESNTVEPLIVGALSTEPWLDDT